MKISQQHPRFEFRRCTIVDDMHTPRSSDVVKADLLEGESVEVPNLTFRGSDIRSPRGVC